nr:hypothetical protein Itr_chr03CG11870 [Ipomoea trifida]
MSSTSFESLGLPSSTTPTSASAVSPYSSFPADAALVIVPPLFCMLFSSTSNGLLHLLTLNLTPESAVVSRFCTGSDFRNEFVDGSMLSNRGSYWSPPGIHNILFAALAECGGVLSEPRLSAGRPSTGTLCKLKEAQFLSLESMCFPSIGASELIFEVNGSSNLDA